MVVPLVVVGGTPVSPVWILKDLPDRPSLDDQARSAKFAPTVHRPVSRQGQYGALQLLRSLVRLQKAATETRQTSPFERGTRGETQQTHHRLAAPRNSPCRL